GSSAAATASALNWSDHRRRSPTGAPSKRSTKASTNSSRPGAGIVVEIAAGIDADIRPHAYLGCQKHSHLTKTRNPWGPLPAYDDLVQAMGGPGISKSHVSRLCEEIDERVDAFLERPIEGEWPYLWIDATYLKVRQGGRI